MLGKRTKLLLWVLPINAVVLAVLSVLLPGLQEKMPLFPVFGEIVCSHLDAGSAFGGKFFFVAFALCTALDLFAIFTKNALWRKGVALALCILNSIDALCLSVFLILSRTSAAPGITTDFSLPILLVYLLLELVLSCALLRFLRKAPKAREKTEEVMIGKLCFVNYLLIAISVGFIVFTFFIPFLYQYRGHMVFWVFLLATEAHARPFSYYGLSTEGITEYRHGRRIRTIPWDSVVQVGAQLDKLYIGSTGGVIITLTGAPLYTKRTKESSFRYYEKYRPNVLYVYDYLESIKKLEPFYGKPDYTEKSDLPE